MTEKKLYIDGKRNGYSEEQTGDTITVGELRDILERALSYGEIEEDTPIYLCNDNGYTYGNIETYSMYVGESWDSTESIENLI